MIKEANWDVPAHTAEVKHRSNVHCIKKPGYGRECNVTAVLNLTDLRLLIANLIAHHSWAILRD